MRPIASFSTGESVFVAGGSFRLISVVSVMKVVSISGSGRGFDNGRGVRFGGVAIVQLSMENVI